MSNPVEQHYSRSRVFESILAALEKTGIEKNNISRKDLAGADEFHVRGLEVTRELAAHAGLRKDMQVLDVGCGIGGPCRLLADEYHCMATGIDITPEYIRTATLLSTLTGLQDRTHFMVADARQLPFEDNSFDIVWTQHVQMNIGDKPAFYSEIYRVLKPGGKFIYYDILSMNNGPIHFPVPWADEPSLSHLITPGDLHKLLAATGLRPVETTDQTAKGILFLETILTRIKNQGAPSVSLQLLIGDSLAEKLGNVHTNLKGKKIVLESGICQKS